jgi:hypothetical protein
MIYEREALLRELGLSEPPVEVASLELEAPLIARGLSGASHQAALRELSEAFLALPAMPPLPITITRHAVEARVVRLEDVMVVKTAGTATQDGRDVWLDGRRGAGPVDAGARAFEQAERVAAAVLLETAEGELLVELVEGPSAWVRVSRVRAVEPSAAEPPSDVARLAEPLVRLLAEPLAVELSRAVPSLEELLVAQATVAEANERSALGVEPWLARRCRELASSPSLVDRVASVGTLCRLWEAPLATAGEGPDAGASPIVDRVAAWAALLSPAERARLESDGVHTAARLRERIDDLLERDDEAEGDEVRALVYERDGLESLRVVLWTCGSCPSLDRELRMTDQAMLDSASALPLPPEVETDELLLAVARNEPLSWWGELPFAGQGFESD